MPRCPLLLLAALSLAGLSPAAAQAPPTAAERAADEAAEHQRQFELGLRALLGRELQPAERAFRNCLRLRAEDTLAHYNLACVYSLRGEAPTAVSHLRSAFELGYRDLAHMARDMDLDPIRKHPAYRRAVAEAEAELFRGLRPAETRAPAGEGSFPTLVWIHADRGRPARDLEGLSQVLPEWGIVAPTGPIHDDRRGNLEGFFWDDRAEHLIVQAVRAFLAAQPRVERSQVYIAGEGSSGAVALNLLVHHPELFAGALAAGPRLIQGLDDVEPEDARAYLVVQASDEAEVSGGEAARDALVRAGCPVILERYPARAPVSGDGALLLRGLGWLRGRDIHLPGAGEELEF